MADENEKILDLEDLSKKEASSSKEKEVSGKEVPKKEPSQKELDWRDSLPEHLSGNKTLQKFNTLEDLASSYVNLEKKLPSADLLNLQDKHTSDTASRLLKQVFNSGEFPNDMDNSLKEALKSVNIPSVLAQSIGEAFSERQKKALEEQREMKLSEYKTELKKINTEGDLERNLKLALDRLGISPAEYKNIFKDESLNPKLVQKLSDFGKKNMSDEQLQIFEGKTANLPSNQEQLTSMLNNLNASRIQITDPVRRMELDKQITAVTAKLQKAMSKAIGGNNLLY